MYAFKRIKGEYEPVSLDDIKEWNYIEDNHFDNKLRSCVAAGVAQVESFINGIVWPSKFVLSLDRVEHVIPFREYPVRSITVAVDGDQIDDSLISYDGNLIRIAGSVTGERMEVSVEAGNEEVEDDIKAAIKLVASELFRNPTDSVKQLPTASQQILKPYRRVNI